MCHVDFYTNNDYGGDKLPYDGPVNHSSMSTSISDGIDSLKTSDNSWLIIFDAESYAGNSHKFYPNSGNSDLNHLDRGNDGDWKNQIRSFKLYDEEPSSWHLGFNASEFNNCYPDRYDDSTISGNAFGYQTQDAKYRIYDPKVSYPDESSMQISVQLDNLNFSISQDDHIYLDIIFDNTGAITKVGYSGDFSGLPEIPKAWILTADAIIALLAVETLEVTAGGSAAIGASAAGIISTVAGYYNKLIGLTQRFEDVDGGRSYFIAMSAHVITNICNNVTTS